MGSPLSPVKANTYKEYFQEMAIATVPLMPNIYLTYVDNTFIL